MDMPVRQEGGLEPGGAIGGGLLPFSCASGSCSGDGCEAIDPWPVHQVRNRNNSFLRLCTSCVLKHHPGSFCCYCFEVLDSYERPPFVHCSKCPSVVHVVCLPEPSRTSAFLCPACETNSPPSFSYFPYAKNSADRSIDLRAAKVLLAAAHLASASMNRAAVLARADAEKKVKEAALARKRAREMLEMALAIHKKDREKEKMEVVGTAAASSASARDLEFLGPKKKAPRPNNMATIKKAQKRAQNRDSEKWMRFSEPIELNKDTQMNANGTGNLNLAGKESVANDEKVNKGVSSVSLLRAGLEERGVAESEKGKPPLNQEPLLSKAAMGAASTNPKNKVASLHS